MGAKITENSSQRQIILINAKSRGSRRMLTSLSQLKLPINVHLRCDATLSTLDLEALKPFVPDFFRGKAGTWDRDPTNMHLSPINIHLSGATGIFLAFLSAAYRVVLKAPYSYTYRPINIHLTPHIYTPLRKIFPIFIHLSPHKHTP
jgi:hypothetical protein